MISVSVRAKTSELKKLVENLNFGNFKVFGKVRHDASRLGEAGYKYMKQFIPISKLPKPHLRDSFKVVTTMVTGGVLLQIYSDVEYALYIDQDATIPARFPRRRRAMMWYEKGGTQKVFAKKAKGYSRKGKFFIAKTEAWLAKNVWNYVDPSLRRYM
jgi:hypothetical protein